MGRLGDAINQWINDFDFETKIKDSAEGSVANLESGLLDYLQDLLDNELPDVDLIPLRHLKEYREKKGTNAFQFVAIAAAVWYAIQPLVQAALAPFADLIAAEVADTINSYRHSPETSLRLHQLGAIDYPEFKQNLDHWGFSEEKTLEYLQLMFRDVQPEALLQLVNRDLLTENQAKTRLERQGYRPVDIPKLLELKDVIPGIQDIIRFAVREAFNPEAIAKYDLNEEFPADVVEPARKQGLDEFWTRKYWQAHWSLPSPNQAFEMFHRLRGRTDDTRFDDTDLQEYLKYADLPRYFRRRMTEIAYTPFTRVDIRRMYKLGVLSEDEVLQAYKDIGYNDEKASKLLQFTQGDASDEELSLSRTAISQGYERGVLDKPEAVQSLKRIGYSEVQAEYFISLVDYKKETRLEDDKRKHYELLYTEKRITEDEFITLLANLGISNPEIMRTLQSLNIKLERQVKKPTRSELENFYELDIIDSDQFRLGLEQLNYRPYTVTRYIRKANIDKQAKAQLEYDRAQAELLKMEREQLKDDYSIAKARLNKRIAEWNVSIKDMLVALHDITDETQRDLLFKRIDIHKQRIAALQYEIATLRVSYELADQNI